MGEKYLEVLINNFYSAYKELQARSCKRCLGHLLAEPTNKRAKAAIKAKGYHEKDNLWQPFKFRRFKPRSDDEYNPDWHLEWY